MWKKKLKIGFCERLGSKVLSPKSKLNDMRGCVLFLSYFVQVGRWITQLSSVYFMRVFDIPSKISIYFSKC